MLLHNFHVLYTFSNLHSIIISMNITIPSSFFLTIKEYHIKDCIPHSTLTSLNQKHSDTAPKQSCLFIYLNSINIPNVEKQIDANLRHYEILLFSSEFSLGNSCQVFLRI